MDTWKFDTHRNFDALESWVSPKLLDSWTVGQLDSWTLDIQGVVGKIQVYYGGPMDTFDFDMPRKCVGLDSWCCPMVVDSWTVGHLKYKGWLVRYRYIMVDQWTLANVTWVGSVMAGQLG